ncbi:MAG TPA: S1-like domain-containing RNA-binding protein [Oceanipulchritudo sp.]|nr:S1-like domain-containing RNA-binding protein [Oceanipulchritudo sp.]
MTEDPSIVVAGDRSEIPPKDPLGVKVPTLKARIGAMNRLKVLRLVSIGAFLDARNLGEILLPGRYLPKDCEVDSFLDVFIYLDSEDRLVATTETPLAMVGEVAYLRVVSVSQVGAFVDWGLPKDLLVPFREQREGLAPDRHYIVYIYLDTASERLVGSTKLHKHINQKGHRYSVGDEVDLIIGDPFDLGYTVIIDRRYTGVIFRNEVFQELEPGQSVTGYIKNLRADGKIDVELQRTGSAGGGREALAGMILDALRAEGGFLALTDASPPEEIKGRFKVSKRAYKRAVGGLYKSRLITIEKTGIRLTETGRS